MEKPPKQTTLHCTPSLQSTLHNKAIAVNSTTPNVICIVLNQQHWSHKCGCQYIQYNIAPYTHHKLQRWSASGNTTHTLCLILCPILRGGRATKRGLRVPNPNSRGHATKRGLRVPNPNSRTQQSVDSEIVPVSSIAPEGWGPKEGGNATSPLHSRGSPTKGTKSEVKTYARAHNDAPSISKYGSLVQPDAQIAALRSVRPLSAPPKGPPVGHRSKRCPTRTRRANVPPLPSQSRLCATGH